MEGINPLRLVDAEQARSCIAGLMVPRADRSHVGQVRLHEHQAQAVNLLKAAIAQFGGALLCDRVGTGKTFTALAIAADYQRTVVVAPAVLRTMWANASRAAGISMEFVSHEALSRGMREPITTGIVIVDEAHHARNPHTRRFAALSRLAHGSDVLLLTATPIHNRPHDLVALLSLFLGHRAKGLSSAEAGTVVVRREDSAAAGLAMPQVPAPRWLDIEHDDSIVAGILGLPPPLPLRDGGRAQALIMHSLIRLWASSDAALRGGLRRRSQRAIALVAALESGTYPSHTELSAWVTGDDAVQLAFPELVATASGIASGLLPVIRAHAHGIDGLLKALPPDSRRDKFRAEALRKIRRRHDGIPIVAFSQYEDTVSAMFRLLARDGGVGALTGRAGRVAGGAISRREVIERFAPRASGLPPPSRAAAVSLLITTDILSEGVNLQDAGVVVHLDLPFTNARLEQRTGRIARLGSLHETVWSYAFRPPATAETVARMEKLLDIKFSFAKEGTSSAHAADVIRDHLAEWRRGSCSPPVASAVRSEAEGFLAAVATAGCVRLLGSIDGRISDEPETLLEAIRSASGKGTTCSTSDVRRAIQEIEDHVAVIRSLGAIGHHDVRHRILRRIGSIVRNARRHSRPRIESLARRARQVVAAPGDSQADRNLTALADGDLPDEGWLEALAAHDVRRIHRPSGQCTEVLAIVIFIRQR